MYIMEVNIRPSLKKKHATMPPRDSPWLVSKAQQAADDDRDKKIITEMWKFVAFGLTIFLGGFAIWGLDQKYCSTLRRWRRDLGLPWGILLEGHGWWHLMTGIGSYFYIVWAIWLRMCLNEDQDTYKLNWPHLWSIPEVVHIAGKGVAGVGPAADSYGTFGNRGQ